MVALSSLRYWASAALLGTVLSFAVAAPGGAAPVNIAFDYSTNTPSTVATILGSAGGAISFSLDVGDPLASGVFGDFSMDIVGPGSVHLGSVSFIGGPVFGDGLLNVWGDAALDPAGGLANVSLWTFTAGASDLPLSLIVTSQLDTIGDPFTPVLTIDLGGDLRLAPVPLPGALVLFGTGLGMLGLVTARRRRAAHRRPDC